MAENDTRFSGTEVESAAVPASGRASGTTDGEASGVLTDCPCGPGKAVFFSGLGKLDLLQAKAQRSIGKARVSFLFMDKL
jgi:hypothetical protein